MRISDWSSDVCSSDLAFGSALKQYGLAVTVADTSKFALRGARKQDLEVHRGDVLDEATQDQLDMGRFQQVIAATENDAYNALVCSDLGPELGVDRLAQTGHDEDRPRSEEHTSELQSLMRISYDVFCSKQNTNDT